MGCCCSCLLLSTHGCIMLCVFVESKDNEKWSSRTGLASWVLCLLFHNYEMFTQHPTLLFYKYTDTCAHLTYHHSPFLGVHSSDIQFSCTSFLIIIIYKPTRRMVVGVYHFSSCLCHMHLFLCLCASRHFRISTQQKVDSLQAASKARCCMLCHLLMLNNCY